MKKILSNKFISQSAREWKVNPLSGKPRNIEYLFDNMEEPSEGIEIHSLWREKEDDYLTFRLREQVGFDMCKFGVYIKSVLEPKFKQAINNYPWDRTGLPKIKVVSLNKAEKSKKAVYLPVKNNEYSEIMILLSPYVKFSFKSNGLNKDSYILEIKVKPEKKDKAMGNMNNYNYEQMEYEILSAIKNLYDLTGIEIDKSIVSLKYVELNLTFVQDCLFDDYNTALKYIQAFARKSFKINTGFQYTEDKKANFQKDGLIKYTALNLSGIKLAAEYIVISLYDKKRETYENTPIDGEIKFADDIQSITRLEFRIKGENKLGQEFGSGAGNFFLLSQAKIEEVFRKLVERYFIKPYESYYKESQKILSNIISNLNVSNNKSWKTDFLKEINSYKDSAGYPIILESTDIDDCLEYDPTFKRNKKLYKVKLHNLLQKSGIFIFDNKNLYCVLGNFMLKVYYSKSLSDCREIDYVIRDKSTLFH